AEVDAGREAECVAPRDVAEERIAEIWGELLGVGRVGALDDFFALAGHPLLATQATMRIRRVYGDIPCGRCWRRRPSPPWPRWSARPPLAPRAAQVGDRGEPPPAQPSSDSGVCLRVALGRRGVGCSAVRRLTGCDTVP